MISSASSVLTEALQEQPRLVWAVLAGLAAAILLMPVHLLMVSLSYSNGHYSYWFSIILLTPILVGLAVRLGAGVGGSFVVAGIGVLLTLLNIFGSQYLVARFLVSQVGIEEGYGSLPLLLPPAAVFEVLALYIQTDLIMLVVWVVGPIASFFLCAVPDGAPGHSLASRTPAAAPLTAAPPIAAAAPTPAPAPAPLPLSDIPADARSLGEPVQVYRTRVTSLAVVGGLFGVIGLGFVAVIVLAHPTSGVEWMIGAFALLFFVLAGYRFYMAFANLNNQVLLFADGISISQKGATTVMRWTDIQSVWGRQYRYSVNAIPVIDQHFYTIQRRDGFKIVLDKTYEKIGDLGAAVQTAVTRVRLPAAIEALNRGETLTFGEISISRSGLSSKNTTIPWSEIQDVRMYQGTLLLQRRGVRGTNRFGPEASDIPNLYLLVTLISAGLDSKRPSA